MSICRSLLWLTLACCLALSAGCASVPPAANHPQNGVSSDGTNEYDGWLFKSLTGKGTTADAKPPATPTQPTNPPAAAPPGDSGVQLASAWAPPPEGTGPLVPGPSSAAGPPPAIPAELPPPPAGAISISAVKVKEEEEKKKKGFDSPTWHPTTSTRTSKMPPVTGRTRSSPRRRWRRASRSINRRAPN